ncbi:hypothetical protein HDF24_14760 [Mucilaginibacter sp. X4EP1]|uniref:hypothetical protein n=1 Tax=Mucilaginibacter sp. X4EP1 TaxID=2723092 RepID=UPI00216833B3|nr:hypothetical protein [Mucilaginibacter sp. X4EP1]MCS3815445.1 hypothetical protein [Mucilaginibacter sp. X4EP1]
MNKLFLAIALLFISISLKAQNDAQSLNLGFAAGGTNPYLANAKTSFSYSGSVNYYPSPYFDAVLEAQIGIIAAGKSSALPYSPANNNFSNKYQAAFLEAQLHFGALIDEDAFLDPLRNFYATTGVGFLHSRPGSVFLNTPDWITYTTPVIPLKVGYLFNIKTNYNDPLLKIDLSYSVNYAPGRGLESYNNLPVPPSVKTYSFYSIGIEYTITVFGRHDVGLLRF